jgi:predicted phosphodiesterase
MKRVGLLFDVHAPYHNEEAYEIALNYLSKLNPKMDELILGGDFMDFHKISFWKDDPYRMSFEDEIDKGRGMLQNIKKRFPRIPVTYLEGNHEARLWRYVVDKCPDLKRWTTVEKILDLNVRQIKYVSNIERMCHGLEPYKLGQLYVLHGHEKKVSFGAINLAKLLYSKAKCNVIFGHHHRPDKTLVKRLNGHYETSVAVGTLGQLAEPYQPINEWCHGFAYVDVHDNGFFEIHNKIIIEGKVLNF